jgi:hypothetical protein
MLLSVLSARLKLSSGQLEARKRILTTYQTIRFLGVMRDPAATNGGLRANPGCHGGKPGKDYRAGLLARQKYTTKQTLW